MPKGTNFEDHLMEGLKNPEISAGFIQAAIEENDPEFLARSLEKVAKAWGIADIAEKTGIARQAIYQMLSEGGNPTLKNVHKILDHMGLQLGVRVKKKIS